MRPRRALLALAGAAVMAAPTAAWGESPQTAHAAAYGVDWIARVPDWRFGLAESRPVICLVDTGVAVTPDTPPSGPGGPIIDRLSVFEDQGDPSAMTHGTMMAAAIAAPANGWGIVGVWPGARILSVQASVGGLFDSAAVVRGISLCRQWSAQTGTPLAAINLSLGSFASDPALATRMTEYVARANADGASVIAAAGNEPGRGTQWPAASPGALAVGAGDPSGGWCGFASHDVLTAVVAPGCDVTAADLGSGAEGLWPGAGSSHGAAIVSGVVAALRALRPDATRTDVEGWLRGTGGQRDGARVLDGSALAVAAGVADLVTPTPGAAVQLPAAASGASVELDAPVRVRTTIRKGQLKVWVKTRVRGQRLEIAVRSRGRWRTGSGSRIAKAKRVTRLPKRVWVRWTSDTAASAWTPMVRPSKSPSRRSWRPGSARGPRPEA